MQPRHRSIHDLTGKTISHHQIIPVFELVEEPWNLKEIVAAITVRHDDVFALGRSDASLQCRTVPAIGNVNNFGSMGSRFARRFIGAAVVGNDDFVAAGALDTRRSLSERWASACWHP